MQTGEKQTPSREFAQYSNLASSAVLSLSLETQKSEENFDLALIASLEIDVVPFLGDSRVPDYLILQLGKMLHSGSQLQQPEDAPPEVEAPAPTAPVVTKPKAHHGRKLSKQGPTTVETNVGTTRSGKLVPRERFSYWCFDLLFLICSDVAKDREPQRRRVASMCLPLLLSRCRSALVEYIADEELRGSLPFQRFREEELLYVLRKLLHLRLWPGTLWAALSSSPSQYAVEQPLIETSLSPKGLITDAVRRSSKAHLFYFYHIFCEIASLPRKTPSAWLSSHSEHHACEGESRIVQEEQEKSKDFVELDARTLARECLKAIGEEMGLSR